MDQMVEWEKLYCAITLELEKWGTNNAYGEGDFYLIDDNYGGYEQKIEVQNSRVWSSQMQLALQLVLRGDFPSWRIIVVFSNSDLGSARGLVLFPNSVTSLD
jgi:hypothetical protein